MAINCAGEHEEFVALLASMRIALENGDTAAGLLAFECLLDHTVDHFGQEDRWMEAALGTAAWALCSPPANAYIVIISI